MRTKFKVCICGCGMLVKKGRRYIQGHNPSHNLGHVREASTNWKGGQQIKNGRVFIYTPDRKYMYTPRARLVMEEKLGRQLLPTEIVHHKNGMVDDDRPENLKLTNRSTHAHFHKKGKRNHNFGKSPSTETRKLLSIASTLSWKRRKENASVNY